MNFRYLSHIVLLVLAFARIAWATPQVTTYQAKIIKPDGYPLEATNVNFKFTFLNPAGTCVLYSETYFAINMTGTGGLISFPLGSGTRAYPTSGSTTLADVFSNRSGASYDCAVGGGPATYSPAVNDVRKIMMQFHDGSGWQTLPAMAINAVPYAMYAGSAEDAVKLNGKLDTDFVQTSALPALACAGNEFLTFNGVSFSCVSNGGGVTSSTVVGALGYTPVDSASFTTLVSSVSSTQGEVSTVSATVYSVSSTVNTLAGSVSNLQNSVAASFAAVVSSQWTTSGTTINYAVGNVGVGFANPSRPLHVNTAVAVSLNDGDEGVLGPAVLTRVDTTKAIISANGASLQFRTAPVGTVAATQMVITASGSVGIGTATPATRLDISGGVRISMESATCAVSYAGTLRYNAGSVEFCNGTTWAAFGVSGAGLQSFNGSTSGTQTFANGASGNAPAFVTANGIHTLNIPLASAAGSVTAGLISNADYVNFSNKITSNAASVEQALGYVPASASALAAINSAYFRRDGTVSMTDQLRGITGTNMNPGFTFAGDTDSGLFSPSADTVAITTSATTVVTFDPFTMYSEIPIQLNNSAQATGYSFANGAEMFSPSVGVLAFRTSGNERLRINAMGNLGIGTTTPITKLDISGGVRISMESATCAVSYAGTLRYNAGNVEFCNGTTWAAFGVSGAGLQSFNGSTSGTQTFANGSSGNAPAFVTDNGVHTLNIPLASAAGSVTAGLISNADYVNFSSKITSSAAAISQVLGYVPASATALGNYLVSANNLSDVASATVARNNLGLGSVATLNSIDLSSTQATGVIADARLANQAGVSSGTQYTKVTVDGKGRVTSGAQLSASDVATALGYTPQASGVVSSQWTVSGTMLNTTYLQVGISGTQVVYLPDQANLPGSLFIGNGGRNATTGASSNTATGMGALYSNTTGYGNVANGSAALYSNTSGSNNTANGFNALYSNTTGSSNIAIGESALYLNTNGYSNVAIGRSALSANTTGYDNVAIGRNALSSNSSGSGNVANGYSALNNNTTGHSNSAFGYQALYSNKTKVQSVAIGYNSMYYADSVSAASAISYNTAVGAYSLQGSSTSSNNTGTMNTALGHSALMNMTSGSGNIGLGYNAGSAITTGNYNVVIGANTGSSIATTSNTVLISDGQGNERMRITSSGAVGIGTSTPVTKFEVSGGVRISMESATCAVSYAGTLRYNTGNVEFCNGTTWAAFSTGSVTSASIQTALGYVPANETVVTNLSSTTATSFSAVTTNFSTVATSFTTYAASLTAITNTVSNITSSQWANVAGGINYTSGTVAIGTVPTTSNTLTVSGNMTASGRMIASVATNANTLAAITADFTNTNFIRATGASNACGTLNVANTSPGGTFTITIPNATATCTTINWNGSATNVKLPVGYGTGGLLVSGVIYSFLDDGAYLWVSYVPY